MTVATIRTGQLNRMLGIVLADDASVLPWTVADRDALIGDAISQSWPDIGKRTTATAALSGSTDVFTIPVAGMRISRIELEGVSPASAFDRVVDWRLYSDTEVRIRPLLSGDASAVLRFSGWVPFAVDGSDIPARLEPIIAMRAASLAYGVLASQLVNYQRQQGLDNSRVVDYQTAVGLSAFWERRYFEQISKDPTGISFAPRRARR